MRVLIAAIGRAGRGPETLLVDNYAGRIRAAGRAVGVSRFDIRELEAPKGLDGEARQLRESALLEGAVGPGGKMIILDECGENLSSKEVAGRFARMRDSGAPEIAFLIGGADGHHPSLSARADLKLAFGRATFPHMLVRAMLAEQIYRITTILSGHPYHRA